MRLLERLVCGLPASCTARTPGSPAMKTIGKSSTWMKAGYGVCGAVAAQAASTNVIASVAIVARREALKQALEHCTNIRRLLCPPYGVLAMTLVFLQVVPPGSQ
jgi:hypothetical protein